MAIGQVLADRTLQHVVPVLDFGQDSETDRYYLVMPRCEESLQQRLAHGLSFDEAKQALQEIALALAEVGDVVHRDLKPGNVLRHEGRWKIADFGIAKFVEDSTSLQTLREALTPSYGAPEQWRGERPTKATDVYALGCIAHALMNGTPPFVGDQDAVRDGHLHGAPPSLQSSPALAAIVSHMLRKAQTARPSLERFLTVLQSADIGRPDTPRGALAAAAQRIAEERSATEAAQAARDAEEAAQRALIGEAVAEINAIKGRLLSEVEAASDDVTRTADGLEWGAARMVFTQAVHGQIPQNPDRYGGSTWQAVVGLTTTLSCQRRARGYGESAVYRYSTTLFFGRPSDTADYRWYEVSFWSMGRGVDDSPFAVGIFDQEAQSALSRGMAMMNVAFGPEPIDAENEATFQDRWLSLIARAASGELARPNQMPPPPSFYAPV